MVLRAFAVHPKHRNTKVAQVAARLLQSRFFKPDVYTSYKSANYWLRFEFPFWWNNLVAALDSHGILKGRCANKGGACRVERASGKKRIVAALVC